MIGPAAADVEDRMHEVRGLVKNGGLHSFFKYKAFFSFIFPCRPRYIGRCTCWMLVPFVKKHSYFILVTPVTVSR